MTHVCSVMYFVIPWTVACQAPLPMEFSRQEYWSGLAISSSRQSSQPRVGTHVFCVSCIGRQCLYHCTTWEVLMEHTHTHAHTRAKTKQCSFILLANCTRVDLNQSNTRQSVEVPSPGLFQKIHIIWSKIFILFLLPSNLPQEARFTF